MAIGITVLFETQAGKGDEFASGFGDVIKTVKATDSGCEMYDLFQSVDDANRYVLVERWATQEDLDGHMKAPHMAGLGPVMGNLAGRPSMMQYAVE